MEELKFISLKKGMRKEHVNKLIGNWILLEDEKYEGNNHPHNWKCKCGSSIPGRQWSNIRTRGSIKCDKCKHGIKDTYNNLKEIYLKPGMKKDEVNSIIERWILLEDEKYEGSRHKHNWKCKCGNSIKKSRTWSVIKSQDAYKCNVCIKNDKESSIRYEDLPSCDKGSKLIDIKLVSGMKKENVNRLIKDWLELEDNLYLGCEYPHNWKCKCGSPIPGRRWSNIRTRGSINCERCKYDIKDTYNNLKDIHLKKGMKKDEVNNLIERWILLEDEKYEGSKHKHNWKCKCGKPIEINRSWSDIKSKGLTKCKVCIKENLKLNHKEKVEVVEQYKYIRSYFKGDKLEDTGKEVKGSNTHIRVEHEFCGNVYDVRASSFINDNQRCSKCCGSKEKSILYNYPEIASMIVYDKNKNKVNTSIISPHTKKRFYFRCPQCNQISKKTNSLTTVVSFGFSCEYCADGISIPEKFMANVLEQLKVQFKTQLSKKDVDWIKSKRKYDIAIYMPYGTVIIELHGLDHYKENKRGKSLMEIKANDRYKKHLAKKNNIKKYYQIDCRFSDQKYLKDNIYKTIVHLFKPEDLEKVNWEDAWNNSQRSIRVKVWDMYKNGKEKDYICKVLNRSKSAINSDIRAGQKYGIL